MYLDENHVIFQPCFSNPFNCRAMAPQESESKKESGRLNLLFDISELADLVAGSADVESFLHKAAGLVANHFKAHVCSIYLYNEVSKHLVLKATQGLKPEAINRVEMKPGQGLVGQSFETLSIVREGQASQNPKFKYFKEAGEDPFNSFLCVPIRRGISKIGVLVVQHRDLDHFSIEDERTIKAVVTQLAGSVENARLLMEIHQGRENKEHQTPSLSFIKGKPASEGIAKGPAVILNKGRKSLLYDDALCNTGYDGQDFKRALDKTLGELTGLQAEFSKKLPESASLIFTAHFMILKDKNFTGKMQDLIAHGRSPVLAVKQVAGKYIDMFRASPHAYMKEKAQDVEDLAVRILKNLKAGQGKDSSDPGGIVIARQIFPSDILKLVSLGTRGIILIEGGLTSHVAILLRSLKIPFIIAEDLRLLTLPESSQVLMDANLGNIYVNPDPDTLVLFEAQKKVEKQLKAHPDDKDARTLDGTQVTLMCNINLISEVSLARKLYAAGIGLYRTEFPFLIRSSFPSEAEQYLIYKNLFDQMGESPVTVRTLDAGGEKSLAYFDSPEEANPELGLRSIRFSLKHTDVFKSQIRAILRAGADAARVRIMFPLVSSLDEFIEARTIVQSCGAALEHDGLSHNPRVEIGMMIELPSVLATIDEFAREADFFSIGTNDFIQYMLAADRSNKQVADYYTPHHPAVVRAIDRIAAAASSAGIDVSVCGEMAHDPQYIPFLVGTGIRILSVDPKFLPHVRKTVSTIALDRAEAFAQRLLSCSGVKETRSALKAWSPEA